MTDGTFSHFPCVYIKWNPFAQWEKQNNVNSKGTKKGIQDEDRYSDF